MKIFVQSGGLLFITKLRLIQDIEPRAWTGDRSRRIFISLAANNLPRFLAAGRTPFARNSRAKGAFLNVNASSDPSQSG